MKSISPFQRHPERWWDASWVVWLVIAVYLLSLIPSWYDIKFWGSLLRVIAGIITLARTIERDILRARGDPHLSADEEDR